MAMERRPHPSYDRAAWRSIPLILAFFGLTFFAALLVSPGLPVWAQIGVFALVVGLHLVVVPRIHRINSCLCPLCGRRLRRPPDATIFPCEGCRIEWQTQWYGWDWLD
jgi:hypothetical protein